jgi:hypothetical protein
MKTAAAAESLKTHGPSIFGYFQPIVATDISILLLRKKCRLPPATAVLVHRAVLIEFVPCSRGASVLL